ncbi:hypothetical protein L873DRAFT_1722055 [Choiromyces venosus 120613-1]|uniref:Uncharacterized protein n=1 Tax=Choiromyces venosus 120613-1 TaxID=1336337 RepID=A0A3N4IYV4_9PEZI|nr:hypothetical protein L873DRAFT_1722055 [Choiromyces venosus 120613-1]
MPPERYLSNAAVEYIEARVDGKVHPAFEDPNTGIRYDPTIDQFLHQKQLELRQERQQQELQASIQHPTSIDTLIEARNEKFQRTLDAYLLKIPSNGKAPPSKLAGKTTWDDVQKLMHTAQAVYQDVGIIRKHLRKFSENAPIFNSWLTLLPQTSYSSTIYGGLKIMFAAAGKLHSVREKVFEILGEIPDRIAKTQVYAELYRSSQQVRERNGELYVAILDIFEHVLGWLGGESGRKFGKAPLKGELYSKELDERDSKMKEVAENLHQEAKLCLHESLRQVKEGSLRQDSRLENMESMNNEILRNTMNANYNTQMQVQILTDVYNKMCQLFKSSTNYDKETGKANIPQTESDARGRFAQHKVHSTELVKSLLFSPVDLATTVQTSLRYGYGASPGEKDRANWIMKSQRMNTWRTCTTSSTLLINGNGEHKKISSLSFITALLVQSLTQSDIPVLHFFCGDNSPTSSITGGPAGLMRSLTAQLLLTHYDFDLTPIRHSRSGTAPKSVKQLCTLFNSLIAQLPTDASLFILIDGITYFENEDRRPETCLIVQRLHENSRGADALVKILVMAPGKSHYVVKVLTEEEGEAGNGNEGMGWGVLHVPANPDGGRVGLSVPNWDWRTSRSVTDLRRAAEQQHGEGSGGEDEGEDDGRKGRKGKSRRWARSEEGRA